MGTILYLPFLSKIRHLTMNRPRLRLRSVNFTQEVPFPSFGPLMSNVLWAMQFLNGMHCVLLTTIPWTCIPCDLYATFYSTKKCLSSSFCIAFRFTWEFCRHFLSNILMKDVLKIVKLIFILKVEDTIWCYDKYGFKYKIFSPLLRQASRIPFIRYFISDKLYGLSPCTISNSKSKILLIIQLKQNPLAYWHCISLPVI